MGMEEQWEALCMPCEEEEMRFIRKQPPNSYVYQCPKCKTVQNVEFSRGDRIVTKMKELGVKIRELNKE